MSYTEITPSLEHIERALFGPSDALLQCWLETPDRIPADLRASLEHDDSAVLLRNATFNLNEDDTGDAHVAEADSCAMPSFLKQTVQRHLHAQQTDFGRSPQAGQIVSVTKIDGPQGSLGWDLPRPHAVLLSESTEHPDIWYGWMVAPETLYAGEWDFVIQEDDGTASPFAGMVQMCNPVHVYLRNIGSVIGQLTDDTLQTVRMLGMYMITNTPLPVMGQAGAWVMRQIDDQVIVTGTDIVDEDDPRVQYQMLYAHAAVAVKEPARLVAAEPSLWNQWLTAIQQSFAGVGEFLVPQPRVAMAMGESNSTADVAYQLGSFPLLAHLACEDETMLQIVVSHQPNGEACAVKIIDDSGMPLFESILDNEHPTAKIRILMNEPFSWHIKGEVSHKELTINPADLESLEE